MASTDASQSSEPHETQYPSQSTAFRGQRIWVSPDFGQSLELYQWIVTSHGAELVSEMGEKDVFHLLPKFQGVRKAQTSSSFSPFRLYIVYVSELSPLEGFL